MSVLTKEQWAALSDLRRIWPSISISLIGGSALAWHGRLGGRETEDLDLTVAISITALQEQLSKAPGWERDPHQEQRWRYNNMVLVDLLPSSDELIAYGEVKWPASGVVMSLVGFSHVHSSGVPATPSDPLLKVASLPSLALLKLVSYLDRPSERAKDLQDLAFLMDCYLDDDDDRLYTGEAADEDLWGEEANAYLLGVDIGRLISPIEMALIDRFIKKVQDPKDAERTQVVLTRRAPRSWGGDIKTALHRVALFERGLIAGWRLR